MLRSHDVSYPITARKIDPEFENMIEELRAKQKQDERRKNLEELEKKKHIHDFEEKAAKNVNKNLNYLTYDMYGRMVDVQNLKNLPLLSRKCNSSLVNPVGEQGKKAKA